MTKKEKKKCKKLLVKYLKLKAKVAKEVPTKYWNKHF
jgi:hypothetical protein